MAKRKYKLYIALIIIIIFYNLSNAYGGEFVGVFSKEKEIVYPFSGFEGQLLYKGEPAAGAVITRIYNQMEQGEVKELVTADDQGRFEFESVFLAFKKPLISAVDYLSYQDIFVSYLNYEFHVWTGSKRVKAEFSEFGDRKPESLYCELTEKIRSIEQSKGLLGTSCHWK